MTANLAHTFRTTRAAQLTAHTVYRVCQEAPTRLAAWAWKLAKLRDRFATYEHGGKVRLVIEPDDLSLADLGDEYIEPSRDAHPEARRAWSRKIRQLDRDGVWYVRTEYADPTTGHWETADSIGGVIGELYDELEAELKASATAAYEEALDAHHEAVAAELASRATFAAGSAP